MSPTMSLAASSRAGPPAPRASQLRASAFRGAEVRLAAQVGRLKIDTCVFNNGDIGMTGYRRGARNPDDSEELVQKRVRRKRKPSGNAYSQRTRKPKEPPVVDPIEGRTLLPGESVIDFGREGRGQMLWYSVITKPQRETTVQKMIWKISEQLEEETGTKVIDEVVVPLKPHKTRSERTGRVVNVNEKVMPGSVLIKCVMGTKLHHLIDRSDMVLGFTGGEGKIGDGRAKARFPIPMKDKQVQNIFKLCELDEEEEAEEEALGGEKVGLAIEAGDVVEVMDGPFKEFTGEVVEVDSRTMKVQANLAIFGRDTRVELEVAHCKVMEVGGRR